MKQFGKPTKIPRERGHSKLVTLWKGPAKVKADNPNSYRGQQIGSSLQNYDNSCDQQVEKGYEKQLLDHQQGFRSVRGTADGIYIYCSV